MAYKDKIRISIPVTPDTDKKLIDMAEKLCTTKSNLCAMLIAQQIDTFSQTWELMRSGKLTEMIVNATSQTLGALDKNADNNQEKYENIIWPNEKPNVEDLLKK